MGIRGLGHNESLDMWCMGVLLYEMTVGKSPFGSNSQETTCRLILKVDLRFPASIDRDAQDLIKGLCKLRPEERLTAPQAKRHAFVQKFYGRPQQMQMMPQLQMQMVPQTQMQMGVTMQPQVVGYGMVYGEGQQQGFGHGMSYGQPAFGQGMSYGQAPQGDIIEHLHR